jgi:Protein of unknown function (DUF2934)
VSIGKPRPLVDSVDSAPFFSLKAAAKKPKVVKRLLILHREGSPPIKEDTVMQDLQRAIRERAYHLWIEGGCQEGHADSHWLAAQREVLAASLGELDGVTASEVLAIAAKLKARASRKKRTAQGKQ